MNSKTRRTAVSMLLAACIGLVTCPIGCGAAQDDYIVVNHHGLALPPISAEPTIPEATVEQLEQCVRVHVADLRGHAHDVKLDIAVTEQGNVEEVQLRSSTLQHQSMESCMIHTLEQMSVPATIFHMRSSTPISGGESMLHDRGPIGFIQALGGTIALAPIVIIAAGVTIAVAVTAEAADALRKRRRIEKLCMPWLLQCLGNKNQPDWNIGDFGLTKDCQSCFEECKHEKGIWPDYKCPRTGYRPN